MKVVQTVVQAGVVVGSGLITFELADFILESLFPSLLFLSYAVGIAVMVYLVVYFYKRNKSNPSKK
jgi:hypothetical protein